MPKQKLENLKKQMNHFWQISSFLSLEINFFIKIWLKGNEAFSPEASKQHQINSVRFQRSESWRWNEPGLGLGLEDLPIVC